jgi:hypothetical protein
MASPLESWSRVADGKRGNPFERRGHPPARRGLHFEAETTLLWQSRWCCVIHGECVVS